MGPAAVGGRHSGLHFPHGGSGLAIWAVILINGPVQLLGRSNQAERALTALKYMLPVQVRSKTAGRADHPARPRNWCGET